MRVGLSAGLDINKSFSESGSNFLVGFVLTERINGPNCGWQPTDKRDLKYETNNSCYWAADGKKRQEWQKNCEK